MTKYEYRIVDTGFISCGDALAEVASEGYRLVAVCNGSNMPLKMFFEREVEPELSAITQGTLEAAGQTRLLAVETTQMNTIYCRCEKPTRAIGSKDCIYCGRNIRAGK